MIATRSMTSYAKTVSRWSRRTDPIAASAPRKMDDGFGDMPGAGWLNASSPGYNGSVAFLSAGSFIRRTSLASCSSPASSSSSDDFEIGSSQRSDYYGQPQANEALFPLSERIDVPPLGAEALKTVSPIVSLFTELTAATALVSNFSASAGDGHCNPKDRETSLNRRDQAPTMPHRRHFDVRRRKKEPAKNSWTNQVVALAIQNVWLGLASRQNHYTQGTSKSAIPPVP